MTILFFISLFSTKPRTKASIVEKLLFLFYKYTFIMLFPNAIIWSTNQFEKICNICISQSS